MKTDRGIRVLDRRDLTLEEKPLTFDVLQTLNDRYALIRQPGAAEQEAELFDFRTGKSVARLDLPPGNKGQPTRIQLRDDAGALAIFPGVADLPPNLGFGEEKWVNTELYLYDLQQEKRDTIPFRTHVTPGSGVPLIYLTLEMGFANDGSLKLTDGDLPRYVKVDPVSGEKSNFPNPPKNRRREPTPSDTEAIVKLVNEKSDIRMHENHYFRVAILRPGGEFLALTPDGKAFLSGDLKEATLAVLPNPSQSVDVSIHALPAAPVN